MTGSAAPDMLVQYYSFEDCPAHEAGLQLVRDVLQEEGAAARIETYEVESVDEAERLRFPGSPTIRVNGVDVVDDPALPVGLACRAYRHPDGAISPLPPRQAVVDAVRMAMRSPQLRGPEAARGTEST